ncbi:MAG: triose-phosphate isomerase [Patescibacteria group bacterium]
MYGKIVVANWKMNPSSPREAKLLSVSTKKVAIKLTKTRTIICPPAIYLPILIPSRPSKKIFWGGQDAYPVAEGPHTGEISVKMIKNSGADYCLVGHSERRRAGDNDKIVREKVQAAIKAGLKPIICVGEEKRDSHGDYLNFLRGQIGACLGDLKKSYYSEIMIAYEPVWAVGTEDHVADTPDNFLHNALFIRKVFAGLAGNELALALPVLYGGSVNVKNAAGILTEGRADGLLVGRESLVPEHFKQILQIADKVK